MPADKSWSYQELTDGAQRRIETLLKRAAHRPEHESRSLYHWAYGVYLGWNFTTFGWQAEGDDERMRALVE